MNQKEKEAYNLINRIRRDPWLLDEHDNPIVDTSKLEGLLEQFQDMAEGLSEDLYEEKAHFIMELIQNAEDNDYDKNRTPELKFELMQDDPTNTPHSVGCLCISNNEKGFRSSQVEAICAFRRSTKDKLKNQGYIGEKGIGFKSVFAVSSRPHVISNGYSFYFNKDKHPKIKLGYVIPTWFDKGKAARQLNLNETNILLPINGEENLEKVISGLGELVPEVILFLKKLGGYSIQGLKGEEIHVVRKNKENWPFVDLEFAHKNGAEGNKRVYWVYSEVIDKPAGLDEEKRIGVDSSELTLAFPVSGTGNNGRVFAYLPTETKSGLPFIINADFVLVANRGAFKKDKKWNTWLRDELKGIFVRGFIKMLNDDRIKYDSYRFIPNTKKSKIDDFFKPVVTSILEELPDKAIIITRTEELARPGEVLYVGKLFSKVLFESPVPRSKNIYNYTHPEISKYQSILNSIGVENFTITEFLKVINDGEWLQKISIARLIDIYKILYKNRKNLGKDDLKAIPIVREEGGNMSCPGVPVYIKIQIESTLAGIESEPRFIDDELHNELKKDKDLYNWAEQAFQIENFSMSGWLLDCYLPALNEKRDELSFDDLLGAMKMVKQFVEDPAGDDEMDKIQRYLPLRINNRITNIIIKSNNQPTPERFISISQEYNGVDQASGRLRCIYTQELEKLVLPEDLDPECGWNNIYIDDESRSNLSILDNIYTPLIKEDQDGWLDFLDILDITNYPEPIEKEYVRYISESIPEHINQKFLEFDERGRRSTLTLKYIDIVSPVWLEDLSIEQVNNLNPREKKDFNTRANAMIQWLEYYTEGAVSSYYLLGTLKWFYRTNYSERSDSSLFLSLRNKPWLPTSKGFKAPSETWNNSQQIRELFKESVPYLDCQVSDSLMQFLGIKTEATSDAIIEMLQQLSSSGKNPKTAEMARYYELLNRISPENIADKFKENALVYCPVEKLWKTSLEVFWEDTSAIYEDQFPSMESNYSTQGSGWAKPFFIKTIGIQETVSFAGVVDLWNQKLDLHKAGELNDPKEGIEKFVLTAYSVFQREVASNEDGATGLERIAGELNINYAWSGEGFHQSTDLFVPDDNTLRKLFDGMGISFAWIPRASLLKEYSDLFQFFKMPRLSQNVDESATCRGSIQRNDEEKFMTQHAKRLIAHYVYVQTKANWEKTREKVVALINSGEFLTEKIVIKYTLNRAGDLSPVTACNEEGVACWDDKDNKVLFTLGDTDERRDELGESIARKIFGNKEDLRGHSVMIGTFLARESSDKLMEKHGLSMPKVEFNFLFNDETSPRGGALEGQDEKGKPEEGKHEHRDVGTRENKPLSQGDNARHESPSQDPGNGQGRTGVSGDNDKPDDRDQGDRHSGQEARDGEKTGAINQSPRPDEGGNQRGKPDGQGRAEPDGTPEDETDPEGQGKTRPHHEESNEEGATRVSEQTPTTGGKSKPPKPKGTKPSSPTKSGGGQSKRAISYVGPEKDSASRERNLDEDSPENIKLGEIAEKKVEEHEQANGWSPSNMNEKKANNPGYDIYSTKGDEERFIEVKGISGTWGEMGVFLSKPQFSAAQAKGSNYWLYVVENAKGDNHKIHRIQDPAGTVTHYGFDMGWKKIIEHFKKDDSKESGKETVPVEQVVDEKKPMKGFDLGKKKPMPMEAKPRQGYMVKIGNEVFLIKDVQDSGLPKINRLKLLSKDDKPAMKLFIPGKMKLYK